MRKPIEGFKRLPGNKVECLTCGKVIVKVGIAIGSHRRSSACQAPVDA